MDLRGHVGLGGQRRAYPQTRAFELRQQLWRRPHLLSRAAARQSPQSAGYAHVASVLDANALAVKINTLRPHYHADLKVFDAKSKIKAGKATDENQQV